jgi:hypothetical protein
MLIKRKQAVVKVADSLHSVEDAIDLALARAAELSATLVTARSDAGLSAMVGQDAFEGAAAAFAALARARGDIVETHRLLTETKAQIGLRTMAIGDENTKPTLAEHRPSLRAVA